MTKFGGFSGEKLRQYISRIEQLEVEKTELASHVRDAYAEAKANGFDPKIMRQVIRIRKLDVSTRNEQEALLDTYKHALGMLVDESAEEAA